MELILDTPQKRWIYRNIWPHPGSRFGNKWAEEAKREDLRWLQKTWPQAAGFCPPPVDDVWKETTPWVREAAERTEQHNHAAGIDEKISGIDFIDLPPASPAAAEDRNQLSGDISTVGILCSLYQKGGKIEKYIVIALVAVAVILILKIIL